MKECKVLTFSAAAHEKAFSQEIVLSAQCSLLSYKKLMHGESHKQPAEQRSLKVETSKLPHP